MARRIHCPEVGPAPRALTPAMVVRMLSLLAVILGLALGHLHLRFSLNELRAQTISQQAREERLLNEVRVLQAKTEALKHRDRLLAYATGELGMVQNNPGERNVLRLDSAVTTRYAMARATSNQPAGEAGEADRIWIEALGQKLGLVSEAHARQN